MRDKCELNDYFMGKLVELSGQLRRSWCAASAEDPSVWRSTKPSAGQSAVTALLVEDRFGGEIVFVGTGADTHYFNRLDGVRVDLTQRRFIQAAPSGPAAVVERGGLEADAAVGARYCALAVRYHETVWGERMSGSLPYYAAGIPGNEVAR